MKHFKSLLIILMVLIAVPVLSADLETVGGFFSTVGDILSNTKVLSVAGILSAASAYFFRNVDVEQIRRTGSRHGFLGGRWLSIKATAVPGFGTAWTMIASGIWQGELIGAVLFALGAWCLLDDIYQHHRQVKERDPLYHSPLHNAFSFLY